MDRKKTVFFHCLLCDRYQINKMTCLCRTSSKRPCSIFESSYPTNKRVRSNTLINRFDPLKIKIETVPTKSSVRPVKKTSYEWYLIRPNQAMMIHSYHGWSRDYELDDWKDYYYHHPITYEEFKKRLDKCSIIVKHS